MMGELAEVSAGQKIKASHINDLIAAYTQLRDQGFVGQGKNAGGVNKIKIMCENLGDAVIPFSPVQLFQTPDTYDYSILMGGTAPIPCQLPPADVGTLVPLVGLAWGVAEDGLPKGGCGRVTIQGEVIALVKGGTTGNYADIASGEAVLSATTTQTRAEIIGRISTSSNDFCKILLGGGGGGAPVLWRATQAPGSETVYVKMVDAAGDVFGDEVAKKFYADESIAVDDYLISTMDKDGTERLRKLGGGGGAPQLWIATAASSSGTVAAKRLTSAGEPATGDAVTKSCYTDESLTSGDILLQTLDSAGAERLRKVSSVSDLCTQEGITISGGTGGELPSPNDGHGFGVYTFKFLIAAPFKVVAEGTAATLYGQAITAKVIACSLSAVAWEELAPLTDCPPE